MRLIDNADDLYLVDINDKAANDIAILNYDIVDKPMTKDNLQINGVDDVDKDVSHSQVDITTDATVNPPVDSEADIPVDTLVDSGTDIPVDTLVDSGTDTRTDI